MSEGRGYFIKDECQAILAQCNFDFMGTLCSVFPCFLCFDSASVLQPCMPLRAEPSPSSILKQGYSAWRSPWFQRDTGRRGWLWLQENFRCTFKCGCGMSELTLPSPLHSLHSTAASLFSLGAWPWLSPISSVFSSLPLPMWASYSFSLFRMQMADFFFFGFKVFSLEPFSLSALKLVCLITSTFWNWKPCRSAFILLKPSQFVANRLGLSDHKQLLLQHPHYLPKVSCRITSRLLSACFVQRSVGSYIPDLQSPTVGICSSF